MSTSGLKINDSREENGKVIEFPVGSKTKLTDLIASDITFMFPHDSKGKIKIAGVINGNGDNMLDPTLTLTNLDVPAFTSLLNSSTLSSSGLSITEASVKMTEKENKTDFTNYHFKINKGTIKNPKIIIPRNKGEKK
ncbi:hypothetical protein BH09BAC5_BH09BAC5_17750 [soil metagenome]